MDKSNSFQQIKNKYSLEEIKEIYSSGKGFPENHVNTSINGVEQYIDNLMSDGLDVSKILVEVCCVEPKRSESFNTFIIDSCTINRTNLFKNGDYSNAFFKFMDPILSGSMRSENETSIASLFHVNNGKYLTKERLGWIRRMDFSQLSMTIDAWLDLNTLDINYVKPVVRRSNNLSFSTILELRSILKEKYLEIKDDPLYKSDVESNSSVLRILCDVEHLENIEER